MVKQQKYRPRVGDVRWVVEWCVKVGMVDDEHPEYGCDPDRNLMRRRTVLTRDDALRVAREVYPQAEAVGAGVTFWEVQFAAYDEDDAAAFPHAGFWEAVREDVECYEGE